MGIAFWHLYPDLLILGETISTVRFKDALVPDTAKLTVGLENVNPERRDGIFWSLPLSHLRFYGDPVLANSHTIQDASRLSMDELQLLAFGSTIATWASKTLLAATGDDLQHILGVIALGRRNGSQFLAEKPNQAPPYFALGHSFISHLLTQPRHAVNNQDLERLRFIAARLRLHPNDCIIRIRKTILEPPEYYHGSGQAARRDLFEYVTAIPHIECAFEAMGPTHIRWIESQSSSIRAAWISIYRGLVGASVSLRVIDRPLYKAHWIPENDFFAQDNLDLARPQRFAYIAFFESALLSDPFGLSVKSDIRHVIGNVGKTGMVMMVAPLAPRIRPLNINKWKQIAHAPFDGHAEDRFTSTSLHLSFTEFKMPFNIGQRGSIDRDIQVRSVETVISVYDRSEWLADLDILLLYEQGLRGHEYVKRLDTDTSTACRKVKEQHRYTQRLTSIDNWEELLNLPDDIGQEHVGVVHSKGNWLARIATACVSVQKGLQQDTLAGHDYPEEAEDAEDDEDIFHSDDSASSVVTITTGGTF
ncbi:hypothetical protein NUW58_g935 [Xylaria curta]|uniref:Uncharacterized protein n=1 Tax=Xylaria curta TaxID=42375 RepID=A0ACC1PMX1_9PEZI|nr:hypothetical protein NUW58_g935 [Xylaria curta]